MRITLIFVPTEFGLHLYHLFNRAPKMINLTLTGNFLALK